MEHYLFPSDYLTFAEGMDTLWDTFRPFTALSMKRNTKKLPSIPAVKTYLSSKLVFMCRIPPWWLSCTLSAQKLLKFSKSFDPSRGWIRRTPSSIPKRRNLPEWLKTKDRKFHYMHLKTSTHGEAVSWGSAHWTLGKKLRGQLLARITNKIGWRWRLREAFYSKHQIYGATSFK